MKLKTKMKSSDFYFSCIAVSVSISYRLTNQTLNICFKGLLIYFKYYTNVIESIIPSPLERYYIPAKSIPKSITEIPSNCNFL